MSTTLPRRTPDAFKNVTFLPRAGVALGLGFGVFTPPRLVGEGGRDLVARGHQVVKFKKVVPFVTDPFYALDRMAKSVSWSAQADETAASGTTAPAQPGAPNAFI